MKKTIIVIAVILMSWTITAQNTVINQTDYNVGEFTKSCLTELKVDSILLMIVTVEKPIKGEYSGYTFKIQDHTYVIYAVSTMVIDGFKKLVAHELVHVKQFESGLRVTGNTATFNQVNYEAKGSEHYNRPYEIEAREVGSELYKKFKMKH